MFDLVVIGGGVAGYEGALYAAQRGLKVALISHSPLGGVCLHNGCIPSKTALYSSKLSLDHREFGIVESEKKIDFATLKKRIGSTVQKLQRGIEYQLKQSSVTVINGTAKILPKVDELFRVCIDDMVIESHKLLLATGSVDAKLPFEVGNNLVTVSELFQRETPPKSIVIVGAGSVGLEMATFLVRCGTKVTILEKKSRIATHFDSELTKILHHSLEKEGVKIVLNADVLRVESQRVYYSVDGWGEDVDSECILVAMGRVPNCSIDGISNLSSIVTNSGFVVNETGETAEPRCYAVGDCTGSPMLAHVASYETRRAINAMCGETVVDSSAVPYVLYTTPELAFVGLSEVDAERDGVPYLVKKKLLGVNGRFVSETSGERGMCKVIMHAETREVLGVQIASPNASELITTATVIIETKLTADKLASIIFPHPTMNEIIKQTIVEEK